MGLKILISGGSGLIGSALERHLKSAGHMVHQLTRKPTPGLQFVFWNFYDPLPADRIETYDAIVHLAGEGIATKRWTTELKDRIRASRLRSTRVLSESISHLSKKPIFICASAIGYYGNRQDELLTEDSKPGRGFLAELCREWEAATEIAKNSGARVINLRIGLVLSKEGGALKKMLPPFRFGIGGALGDGSQFMSWIALEDLIRAIEFLLINSKVSGPVNGVSPNPVTNLDFSTVLARNFHKKLGPRIPKIALKLLMGEMAEELLLASMRVVPAQLEKAGFRFHFPRLPEALSSILN